MFHFSPSSLLVPFVTDTLVVTRNYNTTGIPNYCNQSASHYDSVIVLEKIVVQIRDQPPVIVPTSGL